MSGNTSSWDDYVSNYLKAADVPNENQPYVIISVEDATKGDQNKLQLGLSTTDGKEYLFDLNKTNAVFLKNEAKITTPRLLMGKKIYFKKTQARNPKTNTEVDALRIYKVE